MRIISFIKQVPASTSLEMDKETGVLKRGKEKGKLNPYDLFAIETAIDLAASYNGTVTVLTMGPLAAEESLREAIYMGADDAYLVSDIAFAGSDVLATSKTLSEAVKVIGDFDIIICGKQTTDGDTAQVGAETAAWLNIPHMSNVIKIESITEEGITLISETEEELTTVFMPLPCLISTDKDINTPRLPSYRRKKQYIDKEIKVLTLKDLQNSDPNLYGLTGSATKVVRIFEPEVITKSERLEGDSDYLATRIISILREEKYI